MKKSLIVTICLLLLAVSFGCGKTDDSIASVDVSVPAALATGRYVESEVSLPAEAAGQMILGVCPTGDALALFTAAYDENVDGGRMQYYRHTLSADGTATTAREDWLYELSPFGGNEMHVLMGGDGNLYMSFSDYDEGGSSQAHLLVSRDNGATGEEFKSDDIRRMGMLTSFGVMKDGTVAACNFYDGAVMLVGTDGVKIRDLETGSRGKVNTCAAAGDTVAFSVPGNSVVRVYRAADASYAEYDFKFDESGMAFLAVAKDGAVFVSEATGLYRHAPDGTIWETLVEGATSTLGLPNFYTASLSVAEGGAYPTVYVSDMQKLLCYRYDPDAVAAADKELTVFSLYADDTVRKAIVAFNRIRSDVKVTYTVAMEGVSGGTEQDYIKALNTELLAGTGPDILILDGLPLDSYIEKDVLTDLTPALADAEPTLTNILSAFSKDGKLYAVPTGFKVPLSFAKGGSEAMFASVSALATAAENAGSVPLLSHVAFSCQMLAKYLIRYYGQQLQTGDVQDALAFLRDAKRLSAAIGCTDRIAEGWDVLRDVPQDDLYRDFEDYIASPQVFACASGWATGVLTHPIGSFGGGMESFGCALVLGADVGSVNKQFLPVGVAGVNKASSEQDAAAAFIRTLLSVDAQGGDMWGNQFPVNAQAFSEAIAYENNSGSTDLVLNDGSDFTAEWPTAAQRQAFAALVDTLTTPMREDAALEDMLLPAVTACLDGTSTPEQAADAVAVLMATYLSE